MCTKSISYYDTYIYTNINGALPLSAEDEDPNGHFVYNIQGNSGLGTPLSPFIEESVGSPYFLNNVLTESVDGLPKYYNNNILGRYMRKDYFDADN